VATTVARLQAVLDADTRRFDSAMGRSQTKTQRFGAIAKTAMIGGAAAGLYALGKAAKIGWDEFNAGQQVAAQTNAVIKSTGGVANVTAKHVEELGQAMMLKSGIDDEVIKSGENILLTFRDIRNEVGKGNDVFDRATKAALDVSVAFHKDLNSASVMVGKALQDPIAGLTALTRVGIQFSDKQKEVIANLVETGHKAEAQKLILKELEKQAGGSAAALGQTLGGQINILRERFNNWAGDMVGKALPVLERLARVLIPALNRVLRRGSEFADQLRADWDKLGAILQKHEDTVNKLATAGRFVVRVLTIWIKYQALLYGTLIKVELKVIDVALAITGKLIGAVQAAIRFFRSMGGAARTVGAVVAIAFRIMLTPILNVINAVERLIGLIRSIPSPGDIVGGVTGKIGDIAGSLPGFADGGVVPGPIGTPRLILAHAGETVLPTHRSAVGAPTFNIYGSVIAERDLRSLIQKLNDDWQRRGGR
jgi:hypothetical protein